jgi:outer membrane immunogenic protein
VPSAAAWGFLPINFNQNASGVIAGGQIGANWQFATNWVVGIEADFSGTHLRASAAGPEIAPPNIPLTGCLGGSVPCNALLNRTLDTLGTVRGRVGFSWDRWLAYFTGGFAYGRVGYSGSLVNASSLFPTSFANTKTGGTLGGGLEYALPGDLSNWTIRGEYLFVDLGSTSATVPTPSAGAGLALGFNWNETKVHIARFALNYKFP